MAGGSALQDHGISGFYAIGDASISFDPIASQGLFHALASAEAAGTAIEQQLAGVAEAQVPYQARLMAVHQRYRLHHRATYAGPAARFAEPFWQARALA
jgi:flavin-dependent dehydrogenase